MNNTKAIDSIKQAIRVWLNDGILTPCDLIKIADSYLYPECLDITKDNLSKIKAGMFWYEDNTVSEKLILQKKLKSVVILITNEEVLGDSFEQLEVVGADAEKYITEFECDCISKGQAYFLNFDEMIKIQKAKVFINSSLSLLGKQVWRGTYLTSTVDTSVYMRLVEFRSGVKHLATRTSCGMLRPVFRYRPE